MVQDMFHSVRSICFRTVLLLLLTSAEGLHSQTSIDDVHVVPRTPGIELATATAGPRLSGAGLIRTSTDLVMVPVTITDDMNRPVTGLDRDNFQLFENKQAQEIKNFSSEDAPVSIGIIMDVSGSMSDKLERARDAVHQFCDASNPQDEFFMVTFSDAPRLATDFTDRPEEIENALLGAQSKGRTSLLDAIYMGIHKMKDARYSRRALLIISDGGDNHSRYSDRDVKNAVREADILIYAVGTYDRYVNTQEELLGPELLQNIAGETGGQAYTLSNVRELPEITRAIGNRLRHQYMLAYRPQTHSHDGKWHKIKVKLLLPKKLSSFVRVSARTGYYAGAE